MALKLVIFDVESFKNSGDSTTTAASVALKTDDTTANLILTNVNSEKQQYKLSLPSLSFQKKMYQPTEVTATLLIEAITVNGQKQKWNSIDKDSLTTLFKDKKVSLYDYTGVTTVNGIDTIPAANYVGSDFYVHEVLPTFKSDSLVVALKISSPDKQMTLKQGCRMFVAKKLGAEILKDVVPKLPYDSGTDMSYSTTNMKVLSYNRTIKKYNSTKKEYENATESTEHIFPYLVQYNESIYDMLARTTNRWGEFMYYENGELTVGYSPALFKDITPDTGTSNWKTITFINLEGKQLETYYDRAANYDDNILKSELKRSPNEVSGLLFCPGEEADVAFMKLFASIFKNDKNLPTFIGNELFDQLYNLATQSISVAHANAKFDGQYFLKKTIDDHPDQYHYEDSDFDIYNPFTEQNSDYTVQKYNGILDNELEACQDAVCIDFDTTYPGLKLGQVIKVYGKLYIVVQIDCKPGLTYQVIATAQNSDETNYYPTVLPTGHARFAKPQMATVTDADDPLGKGRVRVQFVWQGKYDAKGKLTYPDNTPETPWLQFTANASGGKGIVGKHYKGDTVFVGFLDGNVERPYVLGALSKGTSSDIQCVTPGGHQLKLKDDQEGITKFLTGMFLPIWGTASQLFPWMGDIDYSNVENSPALGGGFELSDKYGIYKISGSTDGRSVAIASPWGNVNINAFTGINISAPNGNVKIAGKNVTIEAGNNLKLISGKNVVNRMLPHKDTIKGSVGRFFLDIAAAVSKKLLEKAVNVIDLSIIRSTIEIFFRPVEGNLTVKSNRYLMLESGTNKCAYPEAAYASLEDQQKKLNDQVKDDVLFNTRSNLGEMKGISDLFSQIDHIVNRIDEFFIETYNRCRALYVELEADINELDKWKNNPGDATKRVITLNSFEDLYATLKPSLWGKEACAELTEDDLLFSDQVEVQGEVNDIVSDACIKDHNTRLYWRTWTKTRAINDETDDNDIEYKTELYKESVVTKRKELRKKALDTLNRLAKEIFFLEHFEMNKEYVGKIIPWYCVTAIPKDYKMKMVKAFSREKCPHTAYYNCFDDAATGAGGFVLQDLKHRMTSYPGNHTIDEKKYLKRVVALNLLEELGFKDDMRKTIPLPECSANRDGERPVKPDTDPAHSSQANFILKKDCWKDYIESLSGVPPLGRDNTVIGGALKDALNDAKDKITFWKGLGEKFSWSEGSNGQILFGIDNKTYSLTKDNGIMKEENAVSPTITCLKDSDFLDHSPEALRIQNFVENLRKVLEKL